MKKRMMSTVLALLLMITLVYGCGTRQDEENKKQKVTLNEVAHSVFYCPLYVAMENGYFEKAGIDLNLVTGFGADKTMTALLSDEADIGFMGSESTIYTYVGGAKDYAVNFAQLTQRAGNFLVAREPINHFDWEMLRGADVLGGREGGMPEMVFEYILKKHNIDPDADLNIDRSIDFGATAAAFSGGLGEFSVEFEPHATALEEKGDGYVVASLGEESGYVPYTAFCAKRSYMEEHSDIIRCFVGALKQAMQFMEEHTSKELAEVIAPQFPETDVDTIETIIERYRKQDTWKTDLCFSEESFELLENILEDAGQLKERVPYADLVTTEYLN